MVGFVNNIMGLQSERETIRIASINVDGFASKINKRVAVYNWINCHEIDIGCLQEWHKQDCIDADIDRRQFKDYGCHYIDSSTMILFKKDLNIVLLNDKLELDGFSVCWVAVYTKKYILVVGSLYHSPRREANNISWSHITKQMKQIKRRFIRKKTNQKVYFSINGDVNAKHHSWSKITNNRGVAVRSWVDATNLCIINDPENVTHRNRSTGLCDTLDLSILSNELQNTVLSWDVDTSLSYDCNYKLLENGLSDHFCIYLELDLSIAVNVPVYKRTWNIVESKYEEFRTLLKHYMDQFWIIFIGINHIKAAMDLLFNIFTMSIFLAAFLTFGFISYTNNNRYMMSFKAKKLRTQINRLKKARQKEKFRDKIKFKNIKKQLNKLHKKYRRERHININKEINNRETRINDSAIDNTKEFHKLVNQADAMVNGKSSTNIGPLKNNSGNIIASSNEEIANTLQNHFNKPLTDNSKLYTSDHIQFHNHVSQFMENYKFNHNKNNTLINKQFTIHEFMRVICSLNLNSAMSYDMIHYKLIYIGRYELITGFTALVNTAYCYHQHFPHIWRFTPITPIPKPTRSPTICKNVRPISVSPALLRIVSRGINNRLLIMKFNNELCIRIGSNAFQTNCPTEDLVLSLIENAMRHFEVQSFMEIIVMDLKSAYDSVWIDGFFYKCINYFKLDGNFIAWNYSYLNDRYNCVNYNGYSTEWHSSRKCFPQGGPEIPTFWNMFVNDYIGKNTSIEMVNHADDTNIYNSMIDGMKIHVELNHTINTRKAMIDEINNYVDWTLKWKLIVSDTKCNSISISNKGRHFIAYIYKLNGIKLKCVHHAHHTPSYCKHNKQMRYHNFELLDVNELSEDSNKSNSISNYRRDSDGTYRKIKNINYRHKFRFNVEDIDYTIMNKSTRILGIHLDPKLTFTAHINQLIKRVEVGIHKLRKIAYSKIYCLSTHAIWRLYKTVILPMIIFGICIYSSAVNFDQMEILQLKAARIALRVKKTTPRKYIYEMLDIKPIDELLKIYQIKLWNRLSRAPINSFANRIFERWKSFVFSNIKFKYTRWNNRNIVNINYFKYIKNSPISRAFKVVQSLIGTDDAFAPKIRSILKPPPFYCQSIPNNIIASFDYSKPINNSYIFYTDGSMKENPGPGGGAFYSNNFMIPSKIIPINHDTTINYCELVVFYHIFDTIIYFFSKTKCLIKNITIYTDSEFCINLFNINSYCKYYYYYRLMNGIIRLLNIIYDRFNIVIYISKVKSHSGVEGNEIVDGLAKIAANIAKISKQETLNNIIDKQYPNIIYNTNANSLNVDNSLLSNKQKQISKDSYYEKWNEWMLDPTKNGIKWNNDFNFIKMIPKNDENTFCAFKSQSKYFLEEFKFLTGEESMFINQLRTEHIFLSDYACNFFPKLYKHHGYCLECNNNHIESVKHYLLKCNKFEIQRNKLRKALRQINKRFREEIHFNITEILFPHTWQYKPNRDDHNINLILKQNLGVRIAILREVIKYVKLTKRFKDEPNEVD